MREVIIHKADEVERIQDIGRHGYSVFVRGGSEMIVHDNAPEYFIGSDDWDHHYVIPVDKEKEWNEWQDDDDENKDAPEWAVPIGGWPGLVRFKSYIIRA